MGIDLSTGNTNAASVISLFGNLALPINNGGSGILLSMALQGEINGDQFGPFFAVFTIRDTIAIFPTGNVQMTTNCGSLGASIALVDLTYNYIRPIVVAQRIGTTNGGFITTTTTISVLFHIAYDVIFASITNDLYTLVISIQSVGSNSTNCPTGETALIFVALVTFQDVPADMYIGPDPAQSPLPFTNALCTATDSNTFGDVATWSPVNPSAPLNQYSSYCSMALDGTYSCSGLRTSVSACEVPATTGTTFAGRHDFNIVVSKSLPVNSSGVIDFVGNPTQSIISCEQEYVYIGVSVYPLSMIPTIDVPMGLTVGWTLTPDALYNLGQLSILDTAYVIPITQDVQKVALCGYTFASVWQPWNLYIWTPTYYLTHISGSPSYTWAYLITNQIIANYTRSDSLFPHMTVDGYMRAIDGYELNVDALRSDRLFKSGTYNQTFWMGFGTPTAPMSYPPHVAKLMSRHMKTESMREQSTYYDPYTQTWNTMQIDGFDDDRHNGGNAGLIIGLTLGILAVCACLFWFGLDRQRDRKNGSTYQPVLVQMS